jgi:ABC-type transporter Mla subunit MlaD
MTTRGRDVDVLLSKVQGIQKLLGGPSKENAKQEVDEFTKIKQAIAEIINTISKTQDERDAKLDKTGRDVGVIKLGADIRDLLTDADSHLAQMSKTLDRQKRNTKKYPANQVEVKDKQFQNYKEIVKQLKVREDGGVLETQQSDTSFTEFKIRMNTRKNVGAEQAKRDLTQNEQDALDRFKAKDKELDALLEEINQGLDVLKNKGERIGDQLESNEIKIHELEIQLDKTYKALENSNQRLKRILYMYRKPSNFFMQMICVLIILGLIGVIIKLANSGV